MASSNVQSAAPTSSASSTTTTKVSPIVIGISAAGAALVLILIMAGLCLIMQRKRDRKNNKSKRDAEQRPISLRGGRTISEPSNPRKNVLLNEPMQSPMMVQLPNPPKPIAPAAVITPSRDTAPRPQRRPTNTSIPDRSQSIEKRRYPPRHGTTSSLVPSFVTTRSDYDQSVQSPTASSDLNHSRFLQQHQQQPPMPSPSLANTNLVRRVDSISTTPSYADMRAQFDINHAPPVPALTAQPRRTEERVRADLLAALESNEPVLVVKRPTPPAQQSSRGYHQF